MINYILVEEGPPLSSMRLILERSGGLCANTRGKSDIFWMELLEQILAQVRRVALLDNQSSQIAGESGLIYSFT